MSWFKRKADDLHSEPTLREIVLAIAELEHVMAIDLSKLQADVAAQGDLIAKLQVQIGAGSSVEQSVVDGLAAAVETNNTALTALVTAPST